MGLRLSAQAAEELLSKPRLADAFKAELVSRDAYVMTVNAFPYGTFHGTRVKDDVYRPDWSTPERLAYSVAVARAVAGLAAAGSTVSVSTSPLTFKGWDGYEARARDGIRNVAECAVALSRIEAESGVEIVLCMEPEPFCYPETTPELVDVMRLLRQEGVAVVAGELGVSERDADAILKRFVGCCFDTAHQAVEFEDLAESVRALTAAEVRIGKVQLSAAIEAEGAAGVDALAAFAEPTYLHQASVRDGEGKVARYSDLGEPLSQADASAGSVWRVHYHVPLFIERFGALSSTAHLLCEDRFFEALRECGCSHLEVETYTWDVWRRDSGQSGELDEGILRELRWAREHVLRQ